MQHGLSVCFVFFLMLIVLIRAADPLLGPPPADTHLLEDNSNVVPCHRPRGDAFSPASLSQHVQGPHGRLMPELARRQADYLSQPFPLFRAKSTLPIVTSVGLFLQTGQSLFLEGVDGIAGGLAAAMQFLSDLIGRFARCAAEQDLASTDGKGRW